MPSRSIKKYINAYKPDILGLFRMNTPEFFDVSEENNFADYLENQIEDYFVVEENNKIIGAGGINYFYHEKTARISWDIIHPDFQKKGVGSELTLFRLTKIRKNSRIKFVIVRTSQHSNKFYKKMGFEVDSIVPDFWAKGFDLYEMRLKINSSIKTKI